MPRVRMLCTLAGFPGRTEGDIVDVSADVATAWVQDGLAALVRSEAVEDATNHPNGEQTASRRRRGA